MKQMQPPNSASKRLYPTWIALFVVWVMVLLNEPLVFGLMFFAWAAYDITTGESFFVQRVTRREHRVAYWLVVSTWFAFGVLSIAYAMRNA